MRRLRVGVIGAGHLGRIHARILSKLAGVRLMGVADPSAEARSQVTDNLRTAAFADHRELIPNIDAAVIAAPTFLHHALGKELISAGKHVLIEKPLAPTANEARDLHAAAKDAHVVLQVGHVERFNPALQAAQSITEHPKFIDAVRCGGFTGRSQDVGVVLDLMIHDLDLILSMNASPVEQVDAVGVAVLGGHEDLANARLTFADGCVANVSASRISPQPTRRMQVFSKSGFARLDFAGRCATVIRPSELIASGQFTLDDVLPASQAEAVARVLTEESVTPPPVDQLTEELSEFAACIQSSEPPRCGGAEACRAIEVAEMVLSSIAQHHWTDEPAPAPAILRGPHWDRVATPAEHREAS
ncbi:MAG: Gfo/Idh/MocA family oxidoreductase [Pirellulales bacterium]|nr:Gfo/Idh/MocA family oxidoreductase [Pirellulales bacterium]